MAFTDYLLAINVVKDDKAVEKRKLALLRHCGGEDLREMYSQMEFKNSDSGAEIEEGTDGRKLKDVLQRFHDHCNPRSGIVVSRCKFHNISQNGESIDVYLMKLRRLAQSCDFGTQRDSLIRDKLLFGLDDEKVRHKLMKEDDDRLTLDYVIKSLRVAEAAKAAKDAEEKESKVEEKPGGSVEALSYGKKTNCHGRGLKTGQFRKRCEKCGNDHPPRKCPAYGQKCHKCQKYNHFARVCSSSKEVNDIQQDDESEAAELFLGEIDLIESIDASSWYSKVRVGTDLKQNQVVKFKLDTGAVLSVCGRQHCKGGLKPTNKRLFGPGKTPLRCLGVMKSTMEVGIHKISEDIYVVENQSHPLLSKRACEALDLISVNKERCEVGLVKVDEKLFEGLGKVSREYSITLKEGATPYALYVPRPIPFPLIKATDEALQQMVDNKVITKVEDEPSLWVAPMVVVPKPGQKKVRICTDYTQLNKFVVREIHPMATVENSLGKLGDGKVFSKIDANSGFFQIPLSDDSSRLTTFLTHRGRYRYLRLPQGLASSPEIFAAEMNRILEGIDGVIVHMDDVLVYGKDQTEHDGRLEQVLQRIKAAGMTLNKDKCKFGEKSVQFLGYVIDGNGINAGPRIQGIIDFPVPTDITAVRSFLGLANQFARFSNGLADVSGPLRELLRTEVKEDGWYWGQAQEQAFQDVKALFREPPVLATYSCERKTFVTTDASRDGVGAVLSQVQDDGSRRLVAAASRSLNDAEERYAAIELEALAICWAMEKFSQYVLGMEGVTIETDHKSLVPLFGCMFLDKLPPRIQGFKLRLQRFQYSVQHVPGAQNKAADALSRYTRAAPDISDLRRVEAIEFYIDNVVHLNGTDTRLEQFQTEQKQDAVLSKVMEYVEQGWPTYLSSVDTLIQPYFERKGLLTINKGYLMLGTKLIVPLSQQLKVLEDIHRGHLGITKCQARARGSLWWPGMNKSIEDMVKKCRECKEEANKKHEPLRPSATPERPWQILGTDLFHLNGNNYLIIMDYYSRYPEVALLGKDTSSRNTIAHLKSVFSRHGIPECVISDNGPQYSSEEFAKFSVQYGFTHVTSSPKYARSNGVAERAVETVKQMLKKEKDPYLALLAYRSSPVLGLYSPAELLMGRKLRTTVIVHPAQLVPELPDHAKFKEKNDLYKARMKSNHDANPRVGDLHPLSTGDNVILRDNRLQGVVAQPSNTTTRRVIVDTESGGKLMRNRSDVIPVTPPQKPDDGRSEKVNQSSLRRSPRVARKQQ